MNPVKCFKPAAAAAAIIILTIPLFNASLSGNGNPTEEIIRNIISGSKIRQETPPPKADTQAAKQDAIPPEVVSADPPKDAALPKKKTDIKGTGSAEEALYKTGIDFFNSEMYEAAVKSFSELKSRHPQSQQIHSAMIYSGKARMRLRDYTKALEDLAVVTAESGEYPASLFYQGESQMGLGKRTEAITLFYRVATQFSQTPLADDSLIRASQVFLEERKGRQALESAVKIVRYYGDRETIDDAYFMIGQVYEKDPVMRDVEVSRKIYRVFIRKAEAGEKHFSNSPLLRRVKRELKTLESRYFRYEK